MLPFSSPSPSSRSLRSTVGGLIRRKQVWPILGVALAATLGFTGAARAHLGHGRAALSETFTFSPTSGNHFTDPTLQVTTSICDDSYGISSVSGSVNGNGVAFNDGLIASCGGDPGNDKGTMDLTLVPGENDVEVESCNMNSDCSFGFATYYYDAPAMTVESNYHTISYPLPSDTMSFYVFNTGLVTDNVDWSVSCTGGVTCSGSGTFSLAYGSSHPTTITVSGSSASTGKVTFSAHYATYTSVSGSDTTHVVTTVPLPTVTAPSSPQSENPGTNVTLKYPVSVGAYGAGTYTLTPSCGTFASCTVSPSSLTLSASSGDTARVSFHIPFLTASTNTSVGVTASGPATNSASTTVDVGAIGVASVFVGFDAPSVDIGQGTTAHATIVYADGSTLPNASATWSTGNSGIATVNSSTGAVSGAGAGSTSITATVTGGSGSATIPVTTPPSVGIEVSMQRLNAEGSVSRDECLTIAAGDDAAYECGDLRLVHPLPAVKTMNESRAPLLIYNSRHSKPVALVAANVTGFSVSPSSLTATLKVGGHTLTQTYTWNSSCNSATCRIVIPVPADSLSLATGWYADTLQVSVTSGGTPYTATDVGSVAIVNRTASPFGAGWWLDGLEQLVLPADTTKVFWAAGDGNTRLYAQTGVDSVFTPQTVVDRPDTLIQSATGHWLRHLRNGAYVEFDGSGNHIRTVNRERDTTRFAYSGGALDSIVLPSASATRPTYTFSYATNGASLPVLQSVSSPGASGARTTTVSRSGNWQLTQIEDPDGTNVYFTWDGNNRITRRKNRLGDSTTYTYDAAGGLTQAAIDMSRTGDSTIRHTFCSAETRTLVSCAGDGTGATPLLLSSVVTRYDGPRTDSTDVTTFFINRFGAPDTVVDAHSNHTRVHRSLMFPALADSVIDPTSFKQNAVYTVRGLLQASTAVAPYGGSNTTTSYTYDDRWDQLTTVTAPTSEVSYFSYDTLGNRAWQRAGANDSTKVIVGYNARNQVDSVRAPSHGGAQHFTYDPTLGNDSVVTTPMGYHTIIAHDAIGQRTAVRMQTDVADTMPTVEHFVYDIMGRLRVDSTVSHRVAITAFIGVDSMQSLARVVYDSLDAEGTLLGSKRKSVPDIAGAGYQQTTFTYDAAHRRRLRIEDASSSDSTWYDQAGNPIGQITNRQKTIRQTYDALNRLLTRTLPPDTTAQEICGACQNNVGTTFARFPYWPTVLPGGSTSADLIIQGDTATFTYDAAGRMLSAINHDAHVWHSYYANGALHAERDSVRVYDPADTMSGVWGYHPFSLTYTYDLSGRRTVRLDSIAGIGAGNTQTYHYNALGMLDSTTGVESTAHTFVYDAAGRLIGRTSGIGVSESRIYDDDDRMTQRSNNTYYDNLSYDARGKVIGLGSTINSGRINSYSSDSSSMMYDGFGGLILSLQNRGNPVSDEYRLDALGNLVMHDANRDNFTAGRARDSLQYNGPHLQYTMSEPLDTIRSGGGPLITTLTNTQPTYDASGNQIASDTYAQRYLSTNGSGVDVFGPAPTGESFVRSYFDAAERMRVSQRTYFFTDPSNNPRERTTFQEYFYDALGRRIAMRSQRDSTCTDAGDPTPGWDCAQTMERFVWDGNQLLAELRDYGKWGDNASTLNGNGGSTGTFYGEVRYTYALGLFGPDTPLLISSGNLGSIVPEASWRGNYEDGSITSGADFSGSTKYTWPGQQTGLYLAPDARISPIRETSWIGNIVEGKADASGLVYDRNRYYDPTAGRFTQEDPAGLGGGANVYGYAGADPANNSDPFGLCCSGAEALEFFQQMAKAAPAINKGVAIFGAISVLPAIGIMAGGIGSGAVIAAEAGGGEGSLVGLTSKTAAREGLTRLGVGGRQAAAARSAISRATSRETINLIQREGGDLIVQLVRAGKDGYQSIESQISSDGAKTVVQKAFDAAGKLVHLDPKSP